MLKDYTYSGNTESFDIMLEANQTYYLDVYQSSDYVGNYTFSISDTRVQSIGMPATLNIADNNTYTLTPTVSPEGAYNKEISYSSSDTGIAYVSSAGKITAQKPGKAIITATAKDGSGTTASTIVYVTPAAPGTPYLSKSTTTSIKLSWSSVSGADGYTVYRKSGNSWKAVKTTSSTSCTVKKLSAGTGYQFKVKAYVNADGKKYSPYSSVGKLATNPKATSIKSIKKLKKKTYSYGTYYRAKVTWKKVSGATSYKVYYKANGSSYKSLVGTYKKTSATVQLYKSSRTKKYTFYVVPVKTYNKKDYTGAYSKGKKYTFK